MGRIQSEIAVVIAPGDHFLHVDELEVIRDAVKRSEELALIRAIHLRHRDGKVKTIDINPLGQRRGLTVERPDGIRQIRQQQQRIFFDFPRRGQPHAADSHPQRYFFHSCGTSLQTRST
ncbi:hypothetical protein SDC9_166591 [bioreactor metagenome]|uniref:Uncharacterized protein n=1 Tax=bioreactor metagenome TaxID=1076179 RepID=A0A645FXQ0_9ZZZZ